MAVLVVRNRTHVPAPVPRAFDESAPSGHFRLSIDLRRSERDCDRIDLMTIQSSIVAGRFFVVGASRGDQTQNEGFA